MQPDGMAFTFALGVEGAYHHRFLASRIHPGATVYDVGGANRGQTTLLFGRLVGSEGRVVSLEPVEELADCIRRNAELNDLENTHVIVAAAAEMRGTSQFEYYESRSTEGHLQGEIEATGLPESETIQVQTVPLDELCGTEVPPPDVMKIDVEGGAGAVFAGAQNLLDIHEPDIYIELHGSAEQQAVEDELVARGYVVEALDGSVVENPETAEKSPLWCTT
ncbi:FkbM family methyltransferase [Salinibacter ruber]|nr:FkbM family methyltransferase [Salinibacter ruber]